MNIYTEENIDTFIQEAEKLQQPTIKTDIAIEKETLFDKLYTYFDKTMNIVSNETRYDILMYYKIYMIYIISWLGNIFLFIQLFKILQTKDSSSLSIPAFIVLLVTGVSWLFYGFLIQNSAIIVSGIIRVIGSIALLAIIPKYRKNGE